ncbi:MAG: hypothetical protein KatS3mg102_1992 [Planctomycetota bacterium]|nr:MAG: hypothetical protein KatS3mg102_1992 [Planctomycetota bacterium]
MKGARAIARAQALRARRLALGVWLGLLAAGAALGRPPASGAPAAPAAADAATAPAAVQALQVVAAALDPAPFRTLTVQDGGRRKPLDTFARERVQALLETASWQGRDPIVTLFAMAFAPDAFAQLQVVRVRHLELRKLLGLQDSRTSFAALEANPALQAAVAELRALPRERPLGPRQQKVAELYARLLEFRHLADRLRVLPPPGYAAALAAGASGQALTWTGLAEPALDSPEAMEQLRARIAEVRRAFRDGEGPAAQRALAALCDFLTAQQGELALPAWRARLEVAMNRWHPLRIAWAAMLAAACAFGLAGLGYRRGLGRLARVLLVLGLSAAALGLGMRTVLIERAPVATLYEAIVFATFCAVLLGTVFEAAYRNLWFGGAAALAGSLVFMLADLAPGLDRTIRPLQPVLDSYWLNIHVTCMLLSYGAFLLAAVLAVAYYARWLPARGYPRWSVLVPLAVALGGGVVPLLPVVLWGERPALSHFLIAMVAAPGIALIGTWLWVRLTGYGEEIGEQDARALRAIERAMYRVIQVGFLVLTTGIILGAMWAAESWGRYWGWDPKETWAFITWLVYGAFIHGYVAGWFRGPRAALWSVLGFYAVLFTFFGVSYVLPGLHSYLEPAS